MTLMQSHLIGLMYQLGISCHGNGSRVFAITQPSQKHRNKGYFDQNNAALIPNVSQFVQKAHVIVNKVQKFQLLADWQNYV